ncbi:MAG: PAS domain S-box protein, partial [Proteobacteria bacterium]|nr:PAS domain S-box protein [Pseudomonadota bacterium]
DRLQIYNRQYAERFSGIADDFIQPGVTFSDIVAETVKSGMLVTQSADPAKQALENHRNLPSQQEVRYRSGHWVRRSKKRTRDGGVVSVYSDITELKAREQTLKDSERRYRKMLEVLPGAVYERVQSPDGKILFSHVSAGVHEVTGLTPEEIINDASIFIKSIRADFRDQYRAHFRHSADHMVPSDIVFPLTGPDGSLRWLHSTGRPQRRADGSIVWDGIMIDVTEKKIVQEIAERNHQWLLQAIGSMPIGFMLWDPDDRLVLWNERVANYHPDPTLFREGLFFDDMLILPHQDVQNRLGKEAADEWLAERRRQHEIVQGNYEFQGINGQWFVLSERRTVDGFTVTMLLDVTNRHESERRLQESEERHRAMINLSPDAIYAHKLGNIAFCNEAAMHMFGASSADELIGRDILDVTHPDHHDFVRERRSALVEEGTRTVFMRQKRVRLDGSWFWAEVAAAAIAWEGERGGVVVIRDVTAQTAAEEELIRSKEVAELANRAKTEFLANISHELRTPLNAIIGFSDLMQREMLGPLGNAQYVSYIRDIYQSGTHLHDVINDILDLSKIEAGQMELRETSVDVRRAIERCIRVVATRATDNGLKVITDLPDTLHFVIADERKLKQILINLMSNAVKFTEKGGTVTVEARSGPGKGIIIRIIDTGIGISEENMNKVFRPFEQVDGSLSRSHDGTGLGLPLTKSLVELHGGTLALESEIGVGTIATVTLPAARLADQALAAE